MSTYYSGVLTNRVLTVCLWNKFHVVLFRKFQVLPNTKLSHGLQYGKLSLNNN